MQAWQRRLAFVLAVGSGALGLTLSSAGAQTSPPDFPTFPTFTFPTFPDFPTIPPPTMPPPTSPPSTTPPPTMPPPTSTPPGSSPPTSSPPSSGPSIDDIVNDFLDRLIERLDEGGQTFEELRDMLDDILADFGN